MTGSQRKRGPGGVELAECVYCGRVGVVERIHRFSCPHDGPGGEEERRLSTTKIEENRYLSETDE